MRRISLAVSLLLVLAGCSAPGAAPTEPVVAPDVTLEPGETKQLTVEVRNVTGVHLNGRAAHRFFDFSNLTTDPTYDLYLMSFPPSFRWNERRDLVTLTVPVSVPANTSVGEYTYSATKRPGERGANRMETTGTVTVQN